MLGNNILIGAAGAGGADAGHIIEGSGLFNGTSNCLSRTPSSSGNERIGTFNFIVKPSDFADAMIAHQLRTSGGGGQFWIYINSNGTMRLVCEADNGTSKIIERITTRVFRDFSAYYNINIKYNGNLTTDSSCVISINGTEVTEFTTKTNPTSALNLNLMNSSQVFSIGKQGGYSSYLDGYVSRFIYVDGQALDPTSFGEVTEDGFWQINDASGLTFGTTGFLLEGGANVAAGTDSSVGGVVRTAIPTMTGYTSPSGEATASSVYGNTKFPWYTMDGLDDGNIWITANTNTGWITYEFESAKTIVAYSLGVQGAGVSATRYPKNWQFQGWNGSAYVTLDTVTGETGWAASQERTYTVDSPASYIKYRLNITLNNGAGYVELGHFKMHESTVLGNNFIPSGIITATNDSPTNGGA
jgi:hypothetical protein